MKALPLNAAVSLALAFGLSGCASLGTNVSGNFDCKAPTGTCAPTSVIDGQATAMSEILTAPENDRKPALSDAARSGERILKVIFPAFADASGNLHDARSVHVIVDAPRWSERSANPSSRDIVKTLARDIGKQPGETSKQPSRTDPAISPSPQQLFLPASDAEAVPEPLGPAQEGSGMFPPLLHDRAPRIIPDGGAQPVFPTIEAIEKAKAAAKDKAVANAKANEERAQ